MISEKIASRKIDFKSELPTANCWYFLCYSKDIKHRSSKAIPFLQEEIVLSREESGELAIPQGRSWTIQEMNGLIIIYWDPYGVSTPTCHLPEWDTRGWSGYLSKNSIFDLAVNKKAPDGFWTKIYQRLFPQADFQFSSTIHGDGHNIVYLTVPKMNYQLRYFTFPIPMATTQANFRTGYRTAYSAKKIQTLKERWINLKKLRGFTRLKGELKIVAEEFIYYTSFFGNYFLFRGHYLDRLRRRQDRKQCF
jgi:hypothetical protein